MRRFSNTIIFSHSSRWKGKTKLLFLDYKKAFKLELICKNQMFYSISELFKRRGLLLQNWQKYGNLYIKTKMGVAGLIFEPHPSNFENQYNFLRSSNDAKMIFWVIYCFQKSVWSICSCPCLSIKPRNLSIRYQKRK